MIPKTASLVRLAARLSTTTLFASCLLAADVPRPEHPRPDMMRTDWQTLNGSWEFEFDDGDKGQAERWHAGSRKFSKKILVPYCFQSKLSGIGDPAFHDVVWYRRSFQISENWRSKRVLLHFGAVDYEAKVWVNGDFAGSHRGGHVSFSMDVTDHLKAGANTIVLRAVGSIHRPHNPAGETVLERKIGAHLVHANDGHLAARVDRGRGCGSCKEVAHNARCRSLASRYRNLYEPCRP